jgi:hypothetical protein
MSMYRTTTVHLDLTGHEVRSKHGSISFVSDLTACANQEIQNVRVIDLSHITAVFIDQMRQSCALALAVECHVSVGKQKQQQSPRAQNAVDVDQYGQGVRQVLEHVARYDEVLAGLWHGGKPILVEIRQDIRLREARSVTKFGEERTVHDRLPPVEIADRHPWGDWERDVPRSDLDPFPIEMRREAAADDEQFRRSGSCLHSRHSKSPPSEDI